MKTKTAKIDLRISQELRDKIDMEAKKCGVSRAHIVIQILLNWFTNID